MLQELVRPTDTILRYSDIILSDVYRDYRNSDYYERYIKQYEDTPLGHLHDRLLSQFFDTGEAPCLNKINCRIVSERSPSRIYAGDVVDVAYNLRYVNNGGDVVNVAYDEFDELYTSQTLAAIQEVGGESIVLGTFRVVAGENLDLFQLFETENGTRWPHEKPDGSILKPGELGRFSLHPIFDFLSHSSNTEWEGLARNYKQSVLRKLWPLGEEIMRDSRVEIPYIILAPSIRDFVNSSGIYTQKVEGVIPSSLPEAAKTREKFERYWRPKGSKEAQPAVHIACWKVDSEPFLPGAWSITE